MSVVKRIVMQIAAIKLPVNSLLHSQKYTFKFPKHSSNLTSHLEKMAFMLILELFFYGQ